MDVGTISIVLVLGLIVLLAIGMPLGLASAVLALVVMIMKFEPTLLSDPMSFGEGLLTGRPGTGPLYILTQKIFGLSKQEVPLLQHTFLHNSGGFDGARRFAVSWLSDADAPTWPDAALVHFRTRGACGLGVAIRISGDDGSVQPFRFAP